MLVGLYQRRNDQNAPGDLEVANAGCLEFAQHIAKFCTWITGRELALSLLVTNIQKASISDIPFFTNDHWTKLSCIRLHPKKVTKNMRNM